MAEGLGVEIPIGPGMGSINGINEDAIRQRLDSVLASPADVASFGSIPSRYNEGNRGTTYDHNPLTGETLNSMGLPSIGIDRAEPIITEYSKKFADMGKVLIVGVTTLRGEDPEVVLPELMERIFEAGAQLGEANYSCPNIVTAEGGRKPILGFDPEGIAVTRASIIRAIGAEPAWYEKLPPYLDENAWLIPQVAGTYDSERRMGNVGVTLFNTVPNVERTRNGQPVLRIIADVDGEEVITHAGGLSGPAVADRYSLIQYTMLKRLPADVPVIAAGGIWSGEQVHRRMADERVVAAVGVTRFFEGEKLGLSYGRIATTMVEEYLTPSGSL